MDIPYDLKRFLEQIFNVHVSKKLNTDPAAIRIITDFINEVIQNPILRDFLLRFWGIGVERRTLKAIGDVHGYSPSAVSKMRQEAEILLTESSQKKILIEKLKRRNHEIDTNSNTMGVPEDDREAQREIVHLLKNLIEKIDGLLEQTKGIRSEMQKQNLSENNTVLHKEILKLTKAIKGLTEILPKQFLGHPILSERIHPKRYN